MMKLSYPFHLTILAAFFCVTTTADARADIYEKMMVQYVKLCEQNLTGENFHTQGLAELKISEWKPESAAVRFRRFSSTHNGKKFELGLLPNRCNIHLPSDDAREIGAVIGAMEMIGYTVEKAGAWPVTLLKDGLSIRINVLGISKEPPTSLLIELKEL
jgi:hypothetical protein